MVSWVQPIVICRQLPVAAPLVDAFKQRGIGLINGGPSLAVGFDPRQAMDRKPEHNRRRNDLFAVEQERIGQRDEGETEVLGNGRAAVQNLVNDEKIDPLSPESAREDRGMRP